MRGLRLRVVCAAAALAMVPACGVIPHKKGDVQVAKIAASTQTAEQVFARYSKVRESAAELLDSKPLSTVENQVVLAIDSGSFEVSERLAQKQRATAPNPEISDVWAPRLKKYPLWFIVRATDKSSQTVKVRVFERRSAAEPWLLAQSPEMLATTELPPIESRAGASAVPVAKSDSRGVELSPAEAVKLYVSALNDSGSASGRAVADDGFRRQMRDTAIAAGALKGVEFSQRWATKDIDFVVRTEDGGVLVFATLLRRDSYQVGEGLAVSWPDGSPQKAFLGKELSESGQLDFYHQILLYVPATDGAKPRVLGQFGGVVNAEGN